MNYKDKSYNRNYNKNRNRTRFLDLDHYRGSTNFRLQQRRDLCSKNFGEEAYELKLPRWEFLDNSEGERLLCLFNYVPEEALRQKDLFESPESDLVQNILAQVIIENNKKKSEEQEFKIKEILFGNYRQFWIREEIDASSNYDSEEEEDEKDSESLNMTQAEIKRKQKIESILSPFHKFFVEELKLLIKDFQPTRILLLDEKLVAIWNYYFLDKKNLDSVEYLEPLLFIGKVFESPLPGILDIPAKVSFTLSTNWTATKNPRFLNETPYLIHQQKFHLEELLFGKNRYQLTSQKDWVVVNITTIEQFNLFYSRLLNNKVTCIDLETTGLYKLANKILTMHFALSPNEAFNIPFTHKDSPFSYEEHAYITNKLKVWFEEGVSDYLIFHNGKFDLGFFYKQLGVRFFNHKIFDSLSGCYCLDENQKFYTKIGKGVYNLRALAYRYGSTVYDEGALGKSSRTTLEHESLEDIFEYAAKDVIIPYQIHEFQKQEAKRRGYINWDLFVTNQMSAMIHVFSLMESNGIQIDVNYLRELCSGDSKINLLLKEIKDNFKLNDNCKKVNSILLAKEATINNFHLFELSLNKFKRWLVKNLPNKPSPKSNKSAKWVTKSLFETEEDENLLDSYYTELETLFVTLGTQMKEFISTIKKDIRSYRRINNLLQETPYNDLQTNFKRFLELLCLIRDHYIRTYKSTATLESLLDLNTEFNKFIVSEDTYADNKNWIFDILSRDSQQLLFFDILELTTSERRKDGGGKVGSEFQKQYNYVPEVQSFEKFQEYNKLITTYIQGMLSRIEGRMVIEVDPETGEKRQSYVNADLDSQIDHCLRAQYQFADVVTGRCVTGDTKILTDQGEIEIERIVKEKIQCNVLTHKGNWKPVVDWIHSGVRKVYKVTTESGKVVYSTNCHPYLTNEGWLSLKDLKVGDEIKVLEDNSKMFKFEKIVSIEEVEQEIETYDITVEEDHSFIGNGVYLHNSSSRAPNYQNLPSRGDFAYIIKRQFVAPKGCLYIKSDYNAHEVRSWCNVSEDEMIANTFKIGDIMRKQLFLEKDQEKRASIKKDIKGKGDVHKLNYSFFYNKPPEEVTEEERFSIKAVIFGIIYGKSVTTLAEDLNCDLEKADALYKMLFKKFKKGGDWIKKTYSESRNNLIVSSPIGRVRHLGSYLSPNNQVQSSTERKSCNSIVQGFSSDMGYMGGRILNELVFKKFIQQDKALFLQQINAVHDSVEAISKFEHLPISLYLIEHSYTTLVLERYKQLFGFQCTINPEIDSEFGSTMGNTTKFDWLNMKSRVEEEIKYQEDELGYEYNDSDKKLILEKLENNYDIVTKAKTYEIQKYLEKYSKDPKAIFDFSIIQNDSMFSKMLNKLTF